MPEKKKKKPISVQSRKAKGRRFQQAVRDRIIKLFDADPKDVHSTSMGAGGVDVKMSREINDMFPHDIECKNKESINVWKEYEQAKDHTKKTKSPYEPILFIKKNNKKPLAVVDMEFFFSMYEKILEK